MERFIASPTGMGTLSFLLAFGFLVGAFAVGKPELVKQNDDIELDWGKVVGFSALFAVLLSSSVYFTTCGTAKTRPAFMGAASFAVSFAVFAAVFAWSKPAIVAKNGDTNSLKVAGYSAMFSIFTSGMVFLTACRKNKG